MSGEGEDVAVLDVGSNSVRLVLYRLDGRALWTTYNEKVLAGLGRDLPTTGRLSPAGVAQALASLKRFRAVLDGAGVTRVHTAATAAVREAQDGPAFIARIEAETGLAIRTLSGEEEAKYAALGVVAGCPHADGLVGDLGGSSLELVPLKDGAPGEGVTLKLGPLALGAGGRNNGPLSVESLRREIDKRLAPAADRFAGQAQVLQAVGGAWRNLALVHMSAFAYPLRIVHQYEVEADEALELARFVSRQSRGSLERIEQLSRKRAETLPYAALVLEALVERLELKRVAFSAYGLREGLIFEGLSADLQARDPLVEGAQALGARLGMGEPLGVALEAWLTPLWSALPPVFPDRRGTVLLGAACRLADLGARLHPDHRADLAFDQVLRAPIAGQSHPERAFLAQAVFSRYTSQAPTRESVELQRVASSDILKRGRVLGAAMRLGCDLSGRSAPLLAHASLTLGKSAVTLTADADHADLLLGEQTRKRLATLADVLGVEARVRTR